MEQSKALMNPEEQAEWDALMNQGSQYTGGAPRGMFIPTIKLNNSDKVKTKTGVPLGNFYLTFKENGVEKTEDLGLGISGVILKTSYSIKSIYDPSGLVSYYSREFDDFQNDEITVIDSKKKEVLFCGSYGEWKADNQIKSSRGSKNDFVLVVHLYVLQDGDFEKKKVARVSITGKSMSNWFSYTNGDKEKGIVSIYNQGVSPFSHVHEMTSLEEKNPKGEIYWQVAFDFANKLTIEQLRQVVAIQKELNDQLQAIRGKKFVEKQPALPADTGFEQPEPKGNDGEQPEPEESDADCNCIPVIKDGKKEHDVNCPARELKIEDVPF